jgi:hypothetical protein
MDEEFWWENLKEKRPLQVLGTDGKIVLKCILKIWGGVDRVCMS